MKLLPDRFTNIAKQRHDAEFDVVQERVRRAGISFGTAPWSIADGNDLGGGRGVYFKDPNGHILGIIAVPQMEFLR